VARPDRGKLASRPAIAAAVVLAGGSGSRVGAAGNKVYLPLAGRRVVSWSLRAVCAVSEIGPVVLVIRPEDEDLVREILDREPADRPIAVVTGGTTRHQSELNALRHLAPGIGTGEVDVVAVHDAARPLCGSALFHSVIDIARRVGGAVPALPASDVVPIAGAADLRRPTLMRVQTPQAFRARPLLDAFEQATRDGYQGSDTASTVERYADLRIQCVPGHPGNIKVTYAPDLVLAEHLLRRTRMVHDPTVLPEDRPRPTEEGAASQ
jgi:2-C-methyl-D-erythritol 4-phosphate cytidylyltransferase